MPNSETTWSLDRRLAGDTVVIGELALSQALVMNDANYPWLILVPRVVGAVEIFDLDDQDQTDLMNETALLAGVLKDVTRCDKINVAAIGNVVAQLHVHIVARRQGDPAWPKPVWGAAPATPYAQAALDRFIASIRAEVAFG
jgi:diadenosine tetraphosphate (Ap4A) HIT family hydrolase